MKFNIMLIAAAAAGSVSAAPKRRFDMEGMLKEMAPHARRQAANTTVEMIGDLKTQGATTPVGTTIQNCLLGTGPCQDLSTKSYTPPGKLGSDACAADTCCVWDSVATDLVKLFTGSDGLCTDDARAAVRMGFHDAGAWSKTSGSGGADGSLLLSADEITRSENNGMQNIRIELLKVLAKYATFGVGGADLVQFAHNVAVVTCPLGPRQITFVGRDDSIKSDNTGLLPDTNSPATALIELFAEKTFTVIDLISLIGAHTTAKQRFVDTSKAGEPLDSTPGVWDVAFYGEVLGAQPAGVFRLPSDDAFAKNNESTRGFTVFSDPATGQAAWNALYAKAYTRLSLLGVNKINSLTDCTKVLPNAILSVPPPSNSSSSSSSSVSASSTSSSLSSFTGSASTTASSASRHSSYSDSSYSFYSSSASTKPHPTFSSRTSHPHSHTKPSSSVPYTTSTICVTETYVDPILTSTITTTIPLSTTVCPLETATSTASSGLSTITVYATKTFTYTVGSQTKTIITSFPVKPTHTKKTKTSSVSSTPYAPVKPVTSSTPVAPVLTKTSVYYESACPMVATVTATKIVWV